MITQTISERATGASGGEKRGKPRSLPQHKRFFAVIAAAFNAWPESHPFQPDSDDHLRAWLTVAAKHCTIKTFHMGEEADTMARAIPIIIASMLGEHAFCKAQGNDLLVCVPNSISYQAVSHGEFQEIAREVDEIICATLEIDDTDKLLREPA